MDPETTPAEELTIRTTSRGFSYIEFIDLYGEECSLQDSSLATEAAIWFGRQTVNGKPTGARMHLNQAQVAALLPYLQRFVATGSLTGEDSAP